MMGFPSRETVDRVRKMYPAGTRVELIQMDDEQAPQIGTHGTVKGVDDTGSLLMAWDTGGSLNVVYGEDIVKKLDAVRITCYGRTETWDSREEALEFYGRAMAGCEGSERERYSRIFTHLMSGSEECSDE